MGFIEWLRRPPSRRRRRKPKKKKKGSFDVIAGGRTDEPRMTRFVARQLSTAHWFDLSAAERDLGWTPRVSTDEGMRRLAEWLREEGGR